MECNKKVALVSDKTSLPVDYDMTLITNAFKHTNVEADVQFWDNPDVDWSQYDLVVLRSPWTYMENIQAFLAFCQSVECVSTLVNPISVIQWNSDKRYLKQLEDQGIPIVPTEIINTVAEVPSALTAIKASGWDITEVVIKPTVGAYSFGVVRMAFNDENKIKEHVRYLLGLGKSVIIQPYLNTIDEHGETNMIYFNNTYSHAIKKEALLDQQGKTKTPDMEFRSLREASKEEKSLSGKILNLMQSNLDLSQPLLYARLDFIQGKDGAPLLLELEITEPSLSLPLKPKCAKTLVQCILERLKTIERFRCK